MIRYFVEKDRPVRDVPVRVVVMLVLTLALQLIWHSQQEPTTDTPTPGDVEIRLAGDHVFHLELPSEVIDKPPSADLFEGQTDEDELGFSYADADRLLFRMVDQRRSEDELAAQGFDRALIRTVVRRVAQNQYKRLPPVICKLSQRTINHDFRYLRDWGN